MSSPPSIFGRASQSNQDGKRKRSTISDSNDNDIESSKKSAPKRKGRKSAKMLSADEDDSEEQEAGEEEEEEITEEKARKIECAALKVFSTKKTASRIFHYLDLKTCFAFLRIQGRRPDTNEVCQIWNTPSLRERCFLDGTSDIPLYGPIYELNPLLFGGQRAARKYIRHVYFRRAQRAPLGTMFPMSLVGPDFKMNNLTGGLLRDEDGDPVPEDSCEIHFITHPAKNFANDNTQALTLKEHVDLNTSLAQSFLTSPPTEDVELHIRASRERNNSDEVDPVYYERVYIHKAGGIRTGHLFEQAVHFASVHHHKGARIGQHFVWEVKFPRGLRFAMGGHKALFEPLSKKEFEKL